MVNEHRDHPESEEDLSSPQVPWWALTTAGVAPLLLVGGWTIAAGRQPAGFNSIRDTISSLAALGATDRWIMTSALAGLGTCYTVTGLGLRPAGRFGRSLLVAGGLGTLLVAAFPQPVRGNGISHTIAATLAFTALGAWPVLAARRRTAIPLLTRRASVTATTAMFGLLLWFVLENHGSHRGLAERAAALSEALWPLLVVVSSRLAARGAGRNGANGAAPFPAATPS
jgi:hypothetical membrane protein